MDIGNILTELRQEHAQLTEAIIAIERMAAGWQRGRESVAVGRQAARMLGKRRPEIATDNTT